MVKIRMPIYLTPELKNDIEVISKEKGISQNALIIMALHEAIEKEKSKKPQGE